MPNSVAEIVTLPLKAGTDLTTGSHAKSWTEGLTQVASDSRCKSIHWGHQVEHPETVCLVLEWTNTRSAHQTFFDSPAFTPFVKFLTTILAGPLQVHNVPVPNLEPLDRPVTECINFYLPSDPTPHFDQNWARFVEGAQELANEARGFTGGWVLEDQEPDKVGKLGENWELLKSLIGLSGAKEGDESGQKSKLFKGFIGWPSVQAHMDFRQHDKFGDVVKWLRDGPKKIEMCHVEFKLFKQE